MVTITIFSKSKENRIRLYVTHRTTLFFVTHQQEFGCQNGCHDNTQGILWLVPESINKHTIVVFRTMSKEYDSAYCEIIYVRKIFLKTNSSYPLIRTRTCAYQGVRNISFRKVLQMY